MQEWMTMLPLLILKGDFFSFFFFYHFFIPLSLSYYVVLHVDLIQYGALPSIFRCTASQILLGTGVGGSISKL